MGEEGEPSQEEPEKLLDPEDVAEYFKKRGGIPLLAVVDTDGRRFNDLADQLNISTSTLTVRLREAHQLSLIKTESGHRDGETFTVYLPTEIGQTLRKKMISSGITKTYKRLQTYQEQFDEESQEFVDWIQDQETIASDFAIAHVLVDIHGDWDLSDYPPEQDNSSE